MKKEWVQSWMSSKVITITPDTTVPDAHKIMSKEEIRRLPVVNRNGRLVGIVTLGDVREAEPSQATSLNIWELNYLLSNLNIKTIMSKNPITVTPKATIGEVARTMLENRISGLPVVDKNGDLVGIITESDIFSMIILNEWQEEEEDNIKSATGAITSS